MTISLDLNLCYSDAPFGLFPRGGLFKSNHWSDGVFINRHTNVKVALEIKYQRDGGDAWKRGVPLHLNLSR